LNGREKDRAGIMEKKFMDIDDVVKRVVGSTRKWYKISTGDRQPIIRSAFCFHFDVVVYS
jgi:hypothetical protein